MKDSKSGPKERLRPALVLAGPTLRLRCLSSKLLRLALPEIRRRGKLYRRRRTGISFFAASRRKHQIYTVMELFLGLPPKVHVESHEA